jgi:hypothetical protein
MICLNTPAIPLCPAFIFTWLLAFNFSLPCPPRNLRLKSALFLCSFVVRNFPFRTLRVLRVTPMAAAIAALEYFFLFNFSSAPIRAICG